MSKIVGYVRVSTTHQKFDRQEGLTNSCDVVYFDKMTGGTDNRPALQECLSILEDGDRLLVLSIDRLARNLEDLRKIVLDLNERGITVEFTKQGLVFSGNKNDLMQSAMSKLMLSVLGATAEFEKAMINERVQEGIRSAKQRGTKFGGANPKHKETYERNKAAGLHKSTRVRKESSAKLAPVIARVRTMVQDSSDAFTLKEIATRLNLEGFTTIRGSAWTEASLSRFVKQHDIKRVDKRKVAV